MMTTAEAASELGVHERTVRRYLEVGLLASQRLPGGHHRIPESAILNLWSSSTPRRSAVQAKRGDAGTSRTTAKNRPQPVDRRSELRSDQAAPYDLSAASLAAIRSRFSGTAALSGSSSMERHDG
jgi:excisionase family DNA binding protein